MRLSRAAAVLGATVLGVLLLAPGAANAHDEREPVYPDGTGSVPTYRAAGPTLLVCKTDRADFDRRVGSFPAQLRDSNLALWEECQRSGYRHLQAAVDAAQLPGTIIKLLPGLYQEEPSLVDPSGPCAALPARQSGNGLYQVLTWEQQLQCPHNQNLVAILNKRGLQIEGTGQAPGDVVVDAQFKKLNAIRADRANGIYLRNLTAQRTTFNAVYILETDGFVVDKVVGRWNDEYGFLTFADDHGLYTDCEAYGNGDSGVYPGAAQNVNAARGYDVDRYAIEIKNCYSHHNLLGYSGTAGDSVWAHDNVFTENGTGVATDSAFPDHPGMPQNHAKFERNVIGDNNEDYYGYVRDGTCAKPYAERGYEQGVVCPAVGIPTGTGVINPGGNYNIWRDNWVYGNTYAGFVTSWVPGFVRNDTSFGAQFDTSHHNMYVGNRLGVDRTGAADPNGMDFWWDSQGVGSCWQDGTSEPYVLPACDANGRPAGLGIHRYVAEPAKLLKLYVCANYSQAERRIAANCDWFGAKGLARIEVQYALGEAILLSVLAGVLFLRQRRLFGLTGLLLADAGLAIGVFGTAYETTPLAAIGLALFGAGFVLGGRAIRGGLGGVTLAIGVCALLGAVDRGLYMLPWLPVPPSLIRILLEFVWVPWAVVALVRRRRVAAPSAP